MNKFETSFAILKKITKKIGEPECIFIVDSVSEILEFDNETEAKKMVELYQKNSNNELSYFIKKI